MTLHEEFEEAVRTLVTRLDNDMDYEPAMVVVMQYLTLLELNRINAIGKAQDELRLGK